MSAHELIVDHTGITINLDGTTSTSVYASAGCTCGATWDALTQPAHEAVRAAIRHVLDNK